MTEGDDEALLLKRYRSWLTPRQEDAYGDARKPFFEAAVVVLDANVLLDLYRYTKDGRDQVLSVLRMFAKNRRLWLPHQVGIEFSRNRAKAVYGRFSNLSTVSKNLNTRFQSAAKLIKDARDEVAELIRDMAQDDAAADALVRTISEDRVHQALREWQDLLTGHLNELRAAEAVSPQHVGVNDPLLPQIAALFGDRIGEAPSEEAIRILVANACRYRYPNKVPPGFADEQKETDLAAAGDYIVWEQMIQHAMNLTAPRRLIFVSGDTKGDWYEQDDKGKPIRPWPALHDEMRARADAEILVLTPKLFLRGAHEILGAPLLDQTYDEVERVSEKSQALDSNTRAPLADAGGKARHASAPPGPGKHRRRWSSRVGRPDGKPREWRPWDLSATCVTAPASHPPHRNATKTNLIIVLSCGFVAFPGMPGMPGYGRGGGCVVVGW